jgi:hypothetical protein
VCLTTGNVDDFCLGDDVTWTGADDDIAEGELGDVVGYRLPDRDRVRVQFKKGNSVHSDTLPVI